MAVIFKRIKAVLGRLIVLLLLVTVVAAVHAFNLLSYNSSAEAAFPGERQELPVRIRNMLLGIALAHPTFTDEERRRLGHHETWRVLSEDQVSTRVTELVPHGKRGTVVLIPGMGVSPAQFRPDALWFKRLGFSVLIHETRGNGASEGIGSSLGVKEWMDIDAVRERLIEKSFPEPLILYGQGTGAAAVIRSVATNSDRVQGIILDGLPASVEDFIYGLESCHGVDSRWFSKLVQLYLCIMMDEQPEQFDFLSYLENVEVPVLQVHGLLDRVSPYANVQNLKTGLEDSVQVVLSSVSGHEPALRRSGATGIEGLDSFLKQVEVFNLPTVEADIIPLSP